MPNIPSAGNVYGIGATVGAGTYPVFGSKDSAGNLVTPFGNFVWNPNLGASGLWVPWPVDANGNPQVSLSGSSVVGIADGGNNAEISQFGSSDGLGVTHETFLTASWAFIYGTAGWDRLHSADNMAGFGSTGKYTIPTVPYLYNGTTFDIQQANTQGTLLASAARTATTLSANQINYNGKGVIFTLNITAASGTGGLTIVLHGVDPISGLNYDLNTAAAAITAQGEYAFVFYPGASGTSTYIKQTNSIVLPRTWNIGVGAGDSSSYTYSVGYQLIN